MFQSTLVVHGHRVLKRAATAKDTADFLHDCRNHDLLRQPLCRLLLPGRRIRPLLAARLLSRRALVHGNWYLDADHLDRGGAAAEPARGLPGLAAIDADLLWVVATRGPEVSSNFSLTIWRDRPLLKQGFQSRLRDLPHCIAGQRFNDHQLFRNLVARQLTLTPGLE